MSLSLTITFSLEGEDSISDILIGRKVRIVPKNYPWIVGVVEDVIDGVLHVDILADELPVIHRSDNIVLVGIAHTARIPLEAIGSITVL